MSRRAFVSLFVAVAILAPALLVLSRPTSAVQETNPEIVTALESINLYRSWLGIAPLTFDRNLQASSEGHANYYRLNYGDPNLAGMGLHQQTPGKPGFTGGSMKDRATAAGYTGSVNENVGLSGSMIWSTDWFIGTINHRLTLLDPRYTHIGMAAVNEGDIKFEVINLGAPKWEYQAEPEWAAWPPDNTIGVGLSFSGEAPNPFPGASFPTGYPITLSYHGPGELTVQSATITANGGRVESFSSVGSGWLSSKTALIATSAPMQNGTTYEVAVTGSANGEPFIKSWSFTATTGDDKLALTGQAAPPPVTSTPESEPTNEPEPTVEPSPSPSPTPPAGSRPRQVAAPEMNLPDGVAASHPAVQKLWWASDGPVAEEQVKRSWLWGPDSWIAISERYDEEPNRARMVHYFDKARVEINRGETQPEVTAGLLVRDMILGSIQVGDTEFNENTPANVPLAGDGYEFNPDAPTYASLSGVASTEEGRAVAQRAGEVIRETLSTNGAIGASESAPAGATYGSYDETLGHNVAAIFDTYLSGLAVDQNVSVGLPLTEPYWVQTLVAQEPTWVLVQAFERRVLTYTPSNAPEWQIEMGNVGRHYYEWRYDNEAPNTYREPAG
ncbi:MAG: CAP domain-containing protein [Chloroflexia bacterium]|nr:CAP domain-containing protein [Chloroflexia bacterium]